MRIVTPTAQRFVAALSRLGARPSVDRDGVIVASGLSSAEIGDLAADQELTVHELTPSPRRWRTSSWSSPAPRPSTARTPPTTPGRTSPCRFPERTPCDHNSPHLRPHHHRGRDGKTCTVARRPAPDPAGRMDQTRLAALDPVDLVRHGRRGSARDLSVDPRRPASLARVVRRVPSPPTSPWPAWRSAPSLSASSACWS